MTCVSFSSPTRRYFHSLSSWYCGLSTITSPRRLCSVFCWLRKHVSAKPLCDRLVLNLCVSASARRITVLPGSTSSSNALASSSAKGASVRVPRAGPRMKMTIRRCRPKSFNHRWHSTSVSAGGVWAGAPDTCKMLSFRECTWTSSSAARGLSNASTFMRCASAAFRPGPSGESARSKSNSQIREEPSSPNKPSTTSVGGGERRPDELSSIANASRCAAARKSSPMSKSTRQKPFWFKQATIFCVKSLSRSCAAS
mmetsp:Transcript_104566/g.320304  ORF Transcript_104566/g.320304 Transcript_104566/m.320304 type:complete len:255 (-) Transcript_104566:145-909(-)